VNAIPQVAIPQGQTETDWRNILNANSDYMGWRLGAGQRADTAAANRKAALRALAVRYGGLPANFQDVYGDITPDISSVAGANPLSFYSRTNRDYGQSLEGLKRSLAARGALQSGDYGYGTEQLDYQHSADLYDLSNSFLGQVQEAVNAYGGTLQGLNQEQIDQIRQAAQSVYGQGYRLPDATTPAPAGSTTAPSDTPVVNPTPTAPSVTPQAPLTPEQQAQLDALRRLLTTTQTGTQYQQFI